MPKTQKKWKLRPYLRKEKQISILNHNDSELKKDEDNKLKDKEYIFVWTVDCHRNLYF